MRYVKINKKKAKHLFESHKPFIIVPCNIKPQFGLQINNQINFQDSPFDNFIMLLSIIIVTAKRAYILHFILRRARDEEMDEGYTSYWQMCT